MNWMDRQRRFARTGRVKRAKGSHGVSYAKRGIVPCPHCGHHPLKVVFTHNPKTNDKGEVYAILESKEIICPACHKRIRTISSSTQLLEKPKPAIPTDPIANETPKTTEPAEGVSPSQ